MTKNGVLDIARATREINELSERYGLAVDPSAKVADISVGAQQRVEILKTLYRGADILIFDEPTAVLTPSEIDELMAIMKNLVKEGKSIILITHKLDEIRAVSDRVTVIRRGKSIETVGTYNPLVEENQVTLKEDRILAWLADGAQPSDTVRNILSKAGVMKKFHDSKYSK